jgi:cysteine sulfinate desulfinase/cysteine desulfurase-like protein
MGIARGDALSSIRLSLGFDSSEHDVEVALAVIPRVVRSSGAQQHEHESSGCSSR